MIEVKNSNKPNGGGPQNLDNVLSSESTWKERSWHEQQKEKLQSSI